MPPAAPPRVPGNAKPLKALFDVPAPAKLNLFLHVVGRRADGYHLLQSPFLLIDWADRLHFERRGDGVLHRHDLGPALPNDDLCLRAARALQTASGTALGADIHLDKQVPMGAGMGGGSSDAATTLLALNRLWGLRWPRTRLADIGLSLGADLPFFIGGRNAFVEGIGERLTPIELSPAWYAVLKPPGSLDTRDIFAHPALVRDTEAVIVTGYLEKAQGRLGWQEGRKIPQWVSGHGEFGKNDLQIPAFDRCPEAATAARWLEARFGNSRMTGSGSAVFARAGTDDSPTATLSEEDLQGLPTGWVGRMCRSLARHPLLDWAD
ncbi:MAG: 4-(cytidine 5'-diphospho)-2-C-methyl-D-erythritol kinase [Chitinophagaceae bacterium]|nr:4-(cytidine 5'-diphospho)-2-C-methyl-D-erythritol kinase [Rubrivivax sp.]